MGEKKLGGPADGPIVTNLNAVAQLVGDAAPGASVCAALVGRHATRWGTGCHGSLRPGGPRVEEATYYDLASVTKPFTALCAVRLHERGEISLDTPLVEALDEVRGTHAATRTLDQLLSHRAGLAAHLRFYDRVYEGASLKQSDMLKEAADALRPELHTASETFPPVYSDLGYLLVGFALERVLGEPLDELILREVCHPLELDVGSARQLDLDACLERVAPTEHVPARGGLVRGRVHDDNAWVIVGDACAGHAGLFGTARAVAQLGAQLVAASRATAFSTDGEPWLDRAALQRLTRPRPGGTLRAGFDGRSAERSSCGTRFGAGTFGHLGFTGTSLWVDPDAGLVGVLLTNRVHPSREDIRIRSVRPVVYDALAEAMLRS